MQVALQPTANAKRATAKRNQEGANPVLQVTTLQQVLESAHPALLGNSRLKMELPPAHSVQLESMQLGLGRHSVWNALQGKSQVAQAQMNVRSVEQEGIRPVETRGAQTVEQGSSLQAKAPQNAEDVWLESSLRLKEQPLQKHATNALPGR